MCAHPGSTQVRYQSSDGSYPVPGQATKEQNRGTRGQEALPQGTWRRGSLLPCLHRVISEVCRERHSPRAKGSSRQLRTEGRRLGPGTRGTRPSEDRLGRPWAAAGALAKAREAAEARQGLQTGEVKWNLPG